MERLDVHLPDDNEEVVAANGPHGSAVGSGETQLTGWFVVNQRHLDARGLTYLDFPSRWT